MMLLGLFMAVFLVGLLYHVISIGQSITYKEKLQDVADSSAFTAGASYARSMNLIGLMNLTQLTGVSVLLALGTSNGELDNCRSAYDFGRYPYTQCPGLYTKVHPRSEWAESRWTPLLSVITSAAESVRDATPQLVQSEVDAVGKLASPVVITAGLVQRPLPLERVSLDVLCAKAFSFLRPLARQAGLGDLIDWPAVDMPAAMVARYLPSIYCPTVAAAGPLVMKPPNQSGTEPLQVRAFSVGNPKTLPWSNETVQLPLKIIARPADSTRAWINDRTDYLKLGSFALAQAEYYSNWMLANIIDGDIPTNIPEENTFYMHWQARLRRLRVPIMVNTNAIQADLAFRKWVQQALIPACVQRCPTSNCSNQCTLLSTLGLMGNTSLH